MEGVRCYDLPYSVLDAAIDFCALCYLVGRFDQLRFRLT